LVRVISDSSEIDAAIQELHPRILFFDYDFPDQIGLKTLQNSKARYPATPVVMLTRDHSAELAIWALRSRIWDYYIKPVTENHLIGSIKSLLDQCPASAKRLRHNLMPIPDILTRSRPYKIKTNAAPTAYITSYVQQHLDEKITLDHVAGLCGMSKSHFSRTFRRDHSTTFQDFLIQQRIDKAVGLLQDSSLMITQIALAVGFSDLSSCTHTFQRRTGILPSCDRKTLHSSTL
jgi:AraC-like DNA-binding protein